MQIRFTYVVLILVNFVMLGITRVSPVTAQTDLVVFSYDRPLQLYAYLESLEKYVTGLAGTAVIYRSSNQDFENAYTVVVQRFNKTRFIKQLEPAHDTFKPLLLDTALIVLTAPYIMFGVDDIVVTDTIDLDECVWALEEYKAYGFYFRLGKNITQCYTLSVYKDFALPQFQVLDHEILSWKLDGAPYDWSYANSLDMTVFRKSDIQAIVTALSYKTPNSLDYIWNQYKDPLWTGLCYEHTKMVNIPLNIVQENKIDHNMGLLSPADLLEEFTYGFKMDIEPLRGIENRAPHWPYIPTFIAR